MKHTSDWVSPLPSSSLAVSRMSRKSMYFLLPSAGRLSDSIASRLALGSCKSYSLNHHYNHYLNHKNVCTENV